MLDSTDRQLDATTSLTAVQVAQFEAAFSYRFLITVERYSR